MKNSELKKFIKTNIKKLQESSMLNEIQKCCGGWDPGGSCSTTLGSTQIHGNYDCTSCSCKGGDGSCLFGDCVGQEMVGPGGVDPIEPSDLDREPKRDNFNMVREASKMMFTELTPTKDNIIKIMAENMLEDEDDLLKEFFACSCGLHGGPNTTMTCLNTQGGCTACCNNAREIGVGDDERITTPSTNTPKGDKMRRSNGR